MWEAEDVATYVPAAAGRCLHRRMEMVWDWWKQETGTMVLGEAAAVAVVRGMNRMREKWEGLFRPLPEERRVLRLFRPVVKNRPALIPFAWLG